MKKKSAALCKIGSLEFSLGPLVPREVDFCLIYAICTHLLSAISQRQTPLLRGQIRLSCEAKRVGD